MKKLDIGLFITIALMLIGFLVQSLKFTDLEARLSTKDEQIRKSEEQVRQQEQQLKRLNEYAEQNARIPQPGTLDQQGIPESLAFRYSLVYTQLMLLAETAKLPERNMEWLRNLVRRGVLHNVVEQLRFTGVDEGGYPPEIAAELLVTIDWEKSKVLSELKTQQKQDVPQVYNQPPMALARAFTQAVTKEHLTVHTGCTTVTSPNQKALLTLGVPEYMSKGSQSAPQNSEFQDLVRSTLHLKPWTQPKWRKGDSTVMTTGSELTPELSATLTYVAKQETSKETSPPQQPSPPPPKSRAAASPSRGQANKDPAAKSSSDAKVPQETSPQEPSPNRKARGKQRSRPRQ